MHTYGIDKDSPSVVLTHIISHFHLDMKTEHVVLVLVCTKPQLTDLGPSFP